jgi:hypothetical protein
MARVIAIVTELSGKFFAKDAKGNSVELQKGDEILEGMIVYGDSANSASDTIRIHAYSGEEIMLASNQEQLFDVTMVDAEVADLDAVIAEESIAAIIAENTPQKTQEEEEEDIFEEETAAGDEKAKKDADVAGDFAAREGNMADVSSDLRNTNFKAKSRSFEIKSAFEREDDHGVEAIENTTTVITTLQRPTPIVNPIPSPIAEQTPTKTPENIIPPVTPEPTPKVEAPAVSISINDITVNEATGTASVTVTLSNPSTNSITVDYATADNTTEGSDYTSGSGTITFAPNETSKTIEIPISNDGVYEGSETLYVNLSNATGGATIGDSQSVITIKDDGTGTGGNNNDQPQMSINDVTVEEGSKAIFTVTVGAAESPYTVTFNTTTNGTAEDTDITAPIVVKDAQGNTIAANQDGSYTVPANTTSLTVEVPTVVDGVYEGSETFELNGKTEFMSSNVSGTGTIKDDGSANDGDDNDGTSDNDMPRVSITLIDAHAVEGTTNDTIVFAVSQSNVSDFDTTVQINLDLNEAEVADIVSLSYTDADGAVVTLSDAGAINDFVTNGATVKIEAGQTSAPNITITVADDTDYERSETIGMSIANPTNAVLSAATSAVGTIFDEDSTNPSQTDPMQIDQEGDKPIADAQIGTPEGITVDEDDLSDGSSPDAGALTKTGTLDITAGTEAFDTVFDYSDGTDSGLTSQGATVYYYLDDTGHTLTASTAATEGAVSAVNTVFEASLTNPTAANAGYSFTLNGSIDHPNANGENTKTVDLDVKVTQAGVTKDTDSFSVTITDDIPSSNNVSDELHIGPSTFNLVLVLDISGSMAWDFNKNSGTSNERLNAMKDSAAAMIDAYGALGEVNVMVTYFGGNNIGVLKDSSNSIWMDASDSKTNINTLTAGNGTYYSDVMDYTADTYINSSNAGDVPSSDYTFVYFMSDGDPTGGHEPTNSTKWDDFVNRPEIDALDAVGITANVATENLNIVAGKDAGDVLGLTVESAVYTVTSSAQMQAKLIESATVSENGNVINDTTNNKLYIVGGADDAYVQSIKIGDTTYTYDGTSITDGTNTIGSGSVMQVATTLQKDGATPIGSSILFDFATGEYTYTINSTLGGVQYNESFAVVIVDNDGDSVTKTLSFDVNTAQIDNTPKLDLDADDTTTVDDSDDYNTAYTLGKQGISIADSDVSITDNDDTDIESATITLTNAKVGDVLFAGTLPSGITASAYTNGVITLSGSATLGDYESAIEAISFYSSDSDKSDRVITVTLNDGDDNSNTATTTIKVADNALHVTATTPNVEEGKSAIFKVTFDVPRNGDSKIYLTTDGEATSGSDYVAQMQYFDTDDLTWKDVQSDAGGSYITIAQGQTRVDVKVKTSDDGTGDDGESLVLHANVSGTVTDLANSSASDATIITEFPSLVVNAPNSVTEGGEAIFEVGLTSKKATDTAVSLTIGGDVSAGDYDAALQYSTDDGATWQNVNGALTIPADMLSVLVKVITSTDVTADDNESLILTATTSDTGISSYGNSARDYTTIVEPLSLNVTEERDNEGDTSVTTTVDANYNYIFNGNGANGTVTDNGDGTLTYTPNTNFSGTDTFSYIKVDKTTGEQTAAVAIVSVAAKADTPTIEINANEAVIESLFDANQWKTGEYSGNSNKYNYSSVSDVNVANVTLANSNYLMQTFEANAGDTLDISFTISGTSGTPNLTAYWGTLQVDGTVQRGDAITINGNNSFSDTLTVPSGADTLIFTNSRTGQASSVSFSGISLEQSTNGVKIYDVAIANDVTDTDGSETLQDVTLVVKDSNGVILNSADYFNTGSYDATTKTWTFTQGELSTLQITVPEATATSGFTLEATTSAKESSNNDTASATTTLTLVDSNDRPLIGDNTLLMSNEANFVGTISETIETYFSNDGGNTFSWNEAKSNLPEIYADGQLVAITFNDATGEVRGTIDNGTTPIFTVKIDMSGAEGQTQTTTNVIYTQHTELLGVERKIEGKIVLPGGGNNDSIVLGFNDANDNASGVDAIVVAHNLIEDTAAEIASSAYEHTVNTNNFYIGVDSNNMNAGQQLIFDFATAGVAVDSTNQSLGESHSNAVSAMDIKLFNFGSEKSGDELFITIYTSSGKEEIRLTQDSDYTSELEYTVRHSGGETIEKIEFLAGNESSFKLGIKGVSVIEYDTNFDMQLGYDITDNDGDSDSGSVRITLDGSDSGNNTIVFDANKSAIDGGAGEDTLVLSGGGLDFAALETKIQNIEKIDLGIADANSLQNLTLADVVAITSSNNDLVIDGDSADSVTFKAGDAGWEKGASDGTYTTYTNTNDASVTLKIDDDIQQPIA